MAEPIWFSPVCDHVLAKVTWWDTNYERGEVHSTCKFNDPVLGIIDKPTRYAHRLIWTKAEMDHLVRIMDRFCTNRALVDEVKVVRDRILPRGVKTFGGGFIVTMSFYPEYVKLIHKTLLEARDGKAKSIEDFQEKGKGLFE